MSFRLLWRCKDEVRRKTGFSEKSERAVSNEAGREDSALDLFGEDGLRKGIEYRIIYEKTKEYVFDLFWSEHTSVDEQSVIDFCSQKGVNYSDLSNNDRELATDAYTNFLQQDYFLEFQESLVDSAEIIY